MKEIQMKMWEGMILPEKNGDWIDLRSRCTYDIRKGDFTMIHLGVAMKLPEGYEGWLVPRSSLFKHYGLIQSNGIGVIDNAYCGDNDEWCLPTYATRDTTVYTGDRVAQFRIVKNMPTVDIQMVDHLSDTDRGGFGSTGVK